MAEEKGGGGSGGESVRASPSFVAVGGRQRFTVELRPGETTIVSWKKLVKDASKVNVPISAPEPPPTNAHPALESRIAPVVQPDENEVTDEPPANRYSAVIEKIERLYMGKHSSDEEDLNDVPDDDEYDTEDSFIDDTELDEYFQVDNSAIKHDGFFVNRGKLERITEPTSSPHLQPKKRRRKDLEKGHGENNDGDAPNKHVKVGKKPVGKLGQLVGKSSDIPTTHSMIMSTQHGEDVNFQISVPASVIYPKKKSTDIKTSLEPPPSRISNGDPSLSLVEEKDIDKQKIGVVPSKNHGSKLKDSSEFSDTSNQRSHGKSSYAHFKSQSGKSSSNVDESDQLVQRKEKCGILDRPDTDVSEAKNSMQTAKAPLMHRKDGSSARPKSTMLEKSIRELHKMVAELRPPNSEVPDADNSSQAIKKRLPPEVKQKLAKVARLAGSQGKMSKELINRLMSILGHLMQLRTLKRNLKLMVNTGLSAKQEKDDKFQRIKKEVTEMIKTRATSPKSKALEHLAGSSDDFQETGNKEKEVVKRKFSMDDALEEKICDLYDLYVEGLDEDAGPQVRKLYAELAELWPNGCMDNHGIKRAICRAKDRRRALYSRHKEQEKIKRKKLLASRTEEITRVEASSISQPQPTQEKMITDSGNQSSSLLNRPVPNMTTTTATATNTGVRIPGPTTNNPSIDRPKQEKLKGNSSDIKTVDALTKKKVKRKPELVEGETNFRPEKLSSAPGEERNKLQKQAPILALPQKPNLQSSAHLPGSEQLG